MSGMKDLELFGFPMNKVEEHGYLACSRQFAACVVQRKSGKWVGLLATQEKPNDCTFATEEHGTPKAAAAALERLIESFSKFLAAMKAGAWLYRGGGDDPRFWTIASEEREGGE